MGAISFSERAEHTWQVAGWAFRQILDDTAQFYADDPELLEEFEQAKLYDGLSVYLLSKEMAAKAVSGMRFVAEGILDGTIKSGIGKLPYNSGETQNQYKSGLRELLQTIPDQ